MGGELIFQGRNCYGRLDILGIQLNETILQCIEILKKILGSNARTAKAGTRLLQ